MTNSFKERSMLPELLDLGPGSYTESEYQECLLQLGQIGRLLGTEKTTLQYIARMKPLPASVLDVGCGGGDLIRRLHETYPDMDITGVDMSGAAIAYAHEALQQQGSLSDHVRFQHTPDGALPFPDKSVDVLLATLVCHHMSDDQLVSFLQRAAKIARRAVIINDLHRHRAAYWLYKWITPRIFPNRLIIHDGLLSIQKGFTRKEWVRLLQMAGIKKDEYTIRWAFPFRWVVSLQLS